MTFDNLDNEGFDSLKEKLDEVIRKKSEQTAALKKLLQELNDGKEGDSIKRDNSKEEIIE